MKKKILLILVLLVSMFFSCCNVNAEGSNNNPKRFVEANQTATTIINGKTINWHYGVYTDGKIYNLTCDNPKDLVGDVVIPSEIDGKVVAGLGEEAMMKATNLTSVTLPDTITIVDGNAFIECTSLEYIDLGGGTSEYYGGFLAGCTNLKTVVTNNQMVNGVMPLTMLDLTDSYSLSSDVEQRLHIDTLIYRDGLKVVNTYSSSGVNAKKIVIPNGVEEIGYYSILSDSLEEIEIPSSVNKFDRTPFAYTNKLKRLVIYSKQDISFPDNLFTNVDNPIDVSTVTIACYKGTSAEAYAKEKGYKVEYISEEQNPTYNLISDTANQTVGHNSEVYSVRIDVPYDKFLSSGAVYIDGKLVNPSNYTIKNGSLILSFAKSYLNKIALGQHQLKVSFANGSATTNFTMVEKVDKQPVYAFNPTTPQENKVVEVPDTAMTVPQIIYFIALVLLAGGIGVFYIAFKPKTD